MPRSAGTQSWPRHARNGVVQRVSHRKDLPTVYVGPPTMYSGSRPLAGTCPWANLGTAV